MIAVAVAGQLVAGDPGLALHVPFDGNAVDVSATGADGVTVGGLSYATGILDQAAAFDGVDDAVTFPGFPDGFESGDISAWSS